MENHKNKKNAFFLTTSEKFVIKNNPLMQLRSIFHKRESLKIQRVIGLLSRFWAIKKAVTKVEERSKFFLFLSLFLSVDINMQVRLNPQKSIFRITVNLFSSITYSFSSASSLFFFFIHFSLLQIYCCSSLYSFLWIILLLN